MSLKDYFKKPNTNSTEVKQQNGSIESFDSRHYKVRAVEQNVYIDLTRYNDNEKIPFYERTNDNYPQILNQLYNSASSIHSACINLKLLETIGGGYEWLNKNTLSLSDQKNIMKFEAKNDFHNLVEKLTLDYIIHKRANVFIYINKGMVRYEYVNPANIRYNKNKKFAYYNIDHQITTYQDVKYPVYTGQNEDGKYVLSFDGYTPGIDVYCLPDYNAGIKYINIASQIPDWYIADMENSVNPSLTIRVPYKISDNPILAEAWRRNIQGQKGVSNNGNVLVLDGNGFDNVPEVTQLTTNQNDKRFEVLSKEAIEQTCYSHNVNPSILGVKTPGSLGMNQELATAYEQFRVTQILPLRNKIERMINILVSYSEDITTNIKINDFQTINTNLLIKGETSNTNTELNKNENK